VLRHGFSGQKTTVSGRTGYQKQQQSNGNKYLNS
jgi:hypothetical protein